MNNFLMTFVEMVADRVVEKMAENAPKTIELRYYTRKEVADILHVTLPTLNRLSKDGILTPKRISGRVLYDSSMIDEAIQEKKIFKYRRG